MLNISFDFDQCLSEEHIQEVAKKTIALGFNVFIVTSRMDGIKRLDFADKWGDNSIVYLIAKLVGIQNHHIGFTNQIAKHLYLMNTEINVHIDDDKTTIKNINKTTDVKCFDCTLPSFENDFFEYLQLATEF